MKYVREFLCVICLMTYANALNVTQQYPSANMTANDTLNDVDSIIEMYYVIHVSVMVPFENDYQFSYNHVKPAVHRALTDAGVRLCDNLTDWNSKNTFKNTCFNVVFNDTKCDADFVLNQAVDIENQRLLLSDACTHNNSSTPITSLDVFLGMTCDYAAGRISSLANHWGWVAIFPGTRSTLFDLKNGTDCCDTLTRNGITATDLGTFVAKLYQQYGWDNSYIVYSSYNNHGAPVHYDTRSDCGTLLAGVSSQLAAVNFTYAINSKMFDKDVVENIDAILDDLSKTARVSLWCIGRKAMRQVMMSARQRGMTSGDYAFLYLDMYNTNISYTWNDTDDQDYYDESTFNVAECDEGCYEALRALEIISLYRPETELYRNFSNDMKVAVEVGSGETVEEYGRSVNPSIYDYYSAILLLVEGVKRSYQENATDFNDGHAFARRLWNITYTSVGELITISETGNEIMNYSLLDMNYTTGKFEVVWNNYNELPTIDWPGSVAPLNIPPCGSYSPCPEFPKVKVLVISLIVVVLLSLGITIVIISRRLAHEKKLRQMNWRVKWEDLFAPIRKPNNISKTSSIYSFSTGKSDIPAMGIIGRQIFTDVRMFNGKIVAVKQSRRESKINVNRKLLLEMQQVIALDNQHLCEVIGAGVDNPVFILSEYCNRGSLQDILEDTSEYEMDDAFKNSFLTDIATGMQYLHHNSISHGNLKSSNCLVDNRFAVKITDYGLPTFRRHMKERSTELDVGEHEYYKNLLWKAPELLRMTNPPIEGTLKGDVYSYAIIAQEVLFGKGVFHLGENREYQPREIHNLVKEPKDPDHPFRPTLQDDDDVIIINREKEIVGECWQELPEARPSFGQILTSMKKIHKQKNLLDSLLKRLEQYAGHLEDKVDEKTAQINAEKERADYLLYQMLPQSVAERLKDGLIVLPESYDSVSVYFSDIVGFTAISHHSKALDIVNMLNDLYTEFDNVVDRYDVYKVETIGDAYMVVSGLPDRNERHASEISKMALDLLESVDNFKIRHMPDHKIKLRIGIHSGPVVAGVIGLKMPRYCLFGDTVNTAARMEQNGQPLRIHVSPSTKEKLDDDEGTFYLNKREDAVSYKGLGTLETWWLVGMKPTLQSPVIRHKSFQASYPHAKKSDSSGYSSDIDSNANVRTSVTGAVEDLRTIMEIESHTSLSDANSIMGRNRVRTPRYSGMVKSKPISRSPDSDSDGNRMSSGHESNSSYKASNMVNKRQKKAKRRRNGSVEGRSAELIAKIPEWDEKQKKHSSIGLKEPKLSGTSGSTVSAASTSKERKHKKNSIRVKFALEDERDKEVTKKKFFKSPKFATLKKKEEKASEVNRGYDESDWL